MRYCEDCYERRLSTQERSRWHFVPFRDKASQGNLKPNWSHLKRRHEELEREDKPSQDDPDSTDHGAPSTFPEEAAVVEDALIFDADPMLPDDGGLEAHTAPDTPIEEHDVLLPRAASLEAFEEPKVERPEVEVERPSLQEYQAKWGNLLEHHSRALSPCHFLMKTCVLSPCRSCGIVLSCSGVSFV